MHAFPLKPNAYILAGSRAHRKRGGGACRANPQPFFICLTAVFRHGSALPGQVIQYNESFIGCLWLHDAACSWQVPVVVSLEGKQTMLIVSKIDGE